jgi:hypothetical protein
VRERRVESKKKEGQKVESKKKEGQKRPDFMNERDLVSPHAYILH